MGTIAKDSRTVHVRYYFTDFRASGGTGTAGLMITANASVPQKRPASAAATQGGSIPGTRGFDAMAAAGTTTFEHTVTVAAGQGTKPDDTVYAVHQPNVRLLYPPGWDSKGTDSVNLFILAPRWDKATYVTRNGGAAIFSNVGALPYSIKSDAVEKAVAEHIRDAFSKPGNTFPKSAGKNVPGHDIKHPLNRLYHDAKRRSDNRAEAIKACKAPWGAGYSQGHGSIDSAGFSAVGQVGAGRAGHSRRRRAGGINTCCRHAAPAAPPRSVRGIRGRATP
ncbi:hypothetical protein [Streptomyces nigrescens]|uniref:hypothetical protein n=1 Tax=Streptomyces nigrescens TaxID=1920 RepID=UPI00348D7101